MKTDRTFSQESGQVFYLQSDPNFATAITDLHSIKSNALSFALPIILIMLQASCPHFPSSFF